MQYLVVSICYKSVAFEKTDCKLEQLGTRKSVVSIDKFFPWPIFANLWEIIMEFSVVSYSTT